jgi:Limiting CO2-inducible proteins B/C beta carbonyic anhydrases
MPVWLVIITNHHPAYEQRTVAIYSVEHQPRSTSDYSLVTVCFNCWKRYVDGRQDRGLILVRYISANMYIDLWIEPRHYRLIEYRLHLILALSPSLRTKDKHEVCHRPSCGPLRQIRADLIAAILVFLMRKLLERSRNVRLAARRGKRPALIDNKYTFDKIQKYFPGSILNETLVNYIKEALKGFGFGESSLVATSLCCDEITRTLEEDLAGIYGHYFAMGGLAGVPFGGVTAFRAMAAHVPDGGSCLVVYGPHVGIDAQGTVGTLLRRGRTDGGSCCDSAIEAANYVKGVVKDGLEPVGAPADALDAEQFFVGKMLLPHGKRLLHAEEPMAELPYAMYDAQTELIEKIVAEGCGKVAVDGVIALLGGIQINTPEQMSDYFLPLRFDILNNRGNLLETISGAPSQTTVVKVMAAFPKALSNAALINKVVSILAPYGIGRSTLLCTSMCCDEVNRPFEKDLQAAFGNYFRIGGLAGFAFGGATAFGEMAAHIPDGGSCLVVYGPHVGVDSKGNVGTVDRHGRERGGNCCGSAVAAAAYVEAVMNGGKKADAPTDPLDFQQAYVGEMLLPYGSQLRKAEDPMVELPHFLFQAQDEMMKRIIAEGCGAVAGRGKIALLGGIHINTPEGVSDYFLPLRFEVMRKNGELVDELPRLDE